MFLRRKYYTLYVAKFNLNFFTGHRAFYSIISWQLLCALVLMDGKAHSIHSFPSKRQTWLENSAECTKFSKHKFNLQGNTAKKSKIVLEI